MNRSETRRTIRGFLLETVIYGVLVLGYFFTVLRYLGGWLKYTFDHERAAYAAVALLLMLGQGVLLEVLTSALLRFFRRWR